MRVVCCSYGAVSRPQQPVVKVRSPISAPKGALITQQLRHA